MDRLLACDARRQPRQQAFLCSSDTEVWILPGKDLRAGGSQLLFRGRLLSLALQKNKPVCTRFPRKVTEAACTLYSPKWSVSTHLRPLLLPTQYCQSHKQLNRSLWVQRERTAANAVSRRSSGLWDSHLTTLGFQGMLPKHNKALGERRGYSWP